MKPLSVHRKKALGIKLSSTEQALYDEYKRNHARQAYKTPRARAKCLVINARRAAKKQGLSFDLTIDWVEERIKNGYCEVTKIPFSLKSMNTGSWGAGSWNPYSPSLDKCIQSKGYTKENVRVVLWMYNLAKSNWTDEDVLKMARALTK